MMDDAWMWSGGWGWAGLVVMCVLMVLFWAGLIAATVAGVIHLGARPSQSHPPLHPPLRAEDLLAQRYARGDIDDDEYCRRVATLRDHRVAP